MDWFAMSSRFYADLDDEGIPEKSQTFFCRALGYMAEKETGGYLSYVAAEKLGLRQWRARIRPLLNGGQMVDCGQLLNNSMTTRQQLDDNSMSETRTIPEQLRGRPGWWFPAWLKWQKPLEAQVRKRKADRERIAQKRSEGENVARQSRNVSRDVASAHNNTEQLPKGSKASNGHNAREREAPRGPSVGIDGWKIIRDTVPPEHPQATKTALALEASAMLTAGTPDTDVRAALELWLSKPNLGPRTLPSLVSEVIRSRDRPATNGHAIGAATTKAAGWLAIGEHDNAQKAIDR